MDIFSSLNKQQAEAVRTTEGPLLILAGPGSGKTKTLTHRIAYLIQQGVDPRSILAVTFTNKASQEMKERVLELLTTSSDVRTASGAMPVMGTFHSVCVRILREHAALLGFTPHFTIYDSQDQLISVKRIMKEVGIDTKQISPQKIIALVSRAKDELKTPELFTAEADNPGARRAAVVYERYQTFLAENNAFDFDDLIMQTVLLLKNDERVRQKLRRRFRYILVDEYQDTNTAQYSLVHLLAEGKGNICVVGDDAQAIYSWRNANFENILNFERDWPKAKVVKLEQNYRSTKNIVAAASQLIKNNSEGYPKNLWTENPTGDNIIVKEVASEYGEGEFVLDEIERLTKDESRTLSDFVVLYRTNAQSRAIEEVFLRAGMPYTIVGGTKFYERQEIKDIVALLRLVHNPRDAASAQRLLRLRAATLAEKLPGQLRRKNDVIAALVSDFQKHYAKNTDTLTEFVTYIVKRSNFETLLRDGTDKGEERWQNVLELQSVTQEYEKLELAKALEKFLEDVTLMQEADKVQYNAALVHLMTLHMAKGLEFPVVFMVGCEEGILPHANSMNSQRELEEERRLCYVGLTRAKHRAYLLFARRRMLWGTTQANPPSSFLFELPQEYLSFEPLSEVSEFDADDI